MKTYFCISSSKVLFAPRVKHKIVVLIIIVFHVGPVAVCQGRLTGVARVVVLGQSGILNEAVSHLTEHDTHQRIDRPIRNGHQHPSGDHQDVPAICKPELHVHKCAVKICRLNVGATPGARWKVLQVIFFIIKLKISLCNSY